MLPDSSPQEPLQAALARILRGPLGAVRDPAALARTLREHGVVGRDLAASTTPGARLRFELYHELVRGRIRGALDVSIPRTLARLGSQRVDHEIDAFLSLRAPRSPYFPDIATELVEFVGERWNTDATVAPYLPELARYELSCFEIAAAEDDPPSPPRELSVDAPLELQRAARLAHYQHAVHLLPEDSHDRSSPPPGDFWLLGYRDAAGSARFLELTPLAAWLVTELMNGATLGDGCKSSCAAVGLAADDAALADIARLLDDLERRGLLLGTR
jgi:hypothetical protein